MAPQLRYARFAVACLFLLGASTLATRPEPADASDHNEPQSINAIAPEVASDAADVYGNFAFPTDDYVVLILTFPAPPYGFEYLDGDAPTEPWDETHPHAYDDRVLYEFHIDRDLGLFGDRNIVDDEYTIKARFGYDAALRRWGVRVEGIPGEDRIEGPVGEPLAGANGTLMQAGLFDEPFFVDLDRFFEGLDTGVLAFRSDVDYFAGYNVHAIVLEIPKEHVATLFRRQVSVWNTTQRLPDDPYIRAGNVCRSGG